jgi:hypothetical protein
MKNTVIVKNNRKTSLENKALVKDYHGDIIFKGKPENLPSIIFVDDKVCVKINHNYVSVDTVDYMYDGKILARVF